jgi:hypothetical protein
MPMFGAENGGSPLDSVAHIIQLALTPVFLLSGIATLLSVFSTRLGRVADRVQAVSDALENADATERQSLVAQLAHLHRRSVTLEVAVVVSGIGGAATGGAVLVMFVGALRDEAVASLLFTLFGLAIVCAIGAISAFTFEMLLAGTGIRAEVAEGRRTAAESDADEGLESHQDGGDGSSSANA